MIQAADELRPLSALKGLARLCLANNPLCKSADAAALRAACVALCPGLTLLDGRPVSQEERDSAAGADVEGKG